MSGETSGAQGIPLTLSPSKHALSNAEGGERNSYFTGLLAAPPSAITHRRRNRRARA